MAADAGGTPSTPPGVFVVTGANGFLGFQLCLSLSTAGHAVLAVVRSTAATAQERPELATMRHVTVFEVPSLTAPRVRALLDTVTASTRVAGIFHAAGMVRYTADRDAVTIMRNANIDAAEAVLSVAAERRLRVVAVSAAGIVGCQSLDAREGAASPPEPAAEDAPFCLEALARMPFFQQKMQLERRWAAPRSSTPPSSDDDDTSRASSPTTSIPIDTAATAQPPPSHHTTAVFIRPTMLLGPGDRSGNSTALLHGFATERIGIVPPGGIAFVDVRDVAVACIRAMHATEALPAGSVVNLSGAEMSIEAFSDKVATLAGCAKPSFRASLTAMRRHSARVAQFQKWFGWRMDRFVDPVFMEMGCHWWSVSTQRAQDVLDWAPRDADDTIRDTIAYQRTTMGLAALPRRVVLIETVRQWLPPVARVGLLVALSMFAAVVWVVADVVHASR